MVHSNIADLQRQMTEALTIALNKKITLEAKLQEAESYILELESRGDGSLSNGVPDEARRNSPLCRGERNAFTISE
jgi:hypothetical protein